MSATRFKTSIISMCIIYPVLRLCSVLSVTAASVSLVWSYHDYNKLLLLFITAEAQQNISASKNPDNTAT